MWIARCSRRTRIDGRSRCRSRCQLDSPDQIWSTSKALILKNISEAKAELSALIEAVSKGEEVLIGKAGVPVAKLVRYTGNAEKRFPGALRGKILIREDFDELPPDIATAFGIER
jgi:antitoxin (DNA-binding transcriptional repressor) of toxin-antitoxin stability system